MNPVYCHQAREAGVICLAVKARTPAPQKKEQAPSSINIAEVIVP
jgi:hypothetical protein